MEGIAVFKGGNKNSMLTIDSVTDKHSGTYTCIAENKAGVVSYSTVLNVNGIFTANLFVYSLSNFIKILNSLTYLLRMHLRSTITKILCSLYFILIGLY